MFDENGFRNHRPQTSGPSDPENGGDEMDEENNQIAHGKWSREERLGSWPKVEFARDMYTRTQVLRPAGLNSNRMKSYENYGQADTPRNNIERNKF